MGGYGRRIVAGDKKMKTPYEITKDLEYLENRLSKARDYWMNEYKNYDPLKHQNLDFIEGNICGVGYAINLLEYIKED